MRVHVLEGARLAGMIAPADARLLVHVGKRSTALFVPGQTVPFVEHLFVDADGLLDGLTANFFNEIKVGRDAEAWLLRCGEDDTESPHREREHYFRANVEPGARLVVHPVRPGTAHPSPPGSPEPPRPSLFEPAPPSRGRGRGGRGGGPRRAMSRELYPPAWFDIENDDDADDDDDDDDEMDEEPFDRMLQALVPHEPRAVREAAARPLRGMLPRGWLPPPPFGFPLRARDGYAAETLFERTLAESLRTHEREERERKRRVDPATLKRLVPPRQEQQEEEKRDDRDKKRSKQESDAADAVRYVCRICLEDCPASRLRVAVPCGHAFACDACALAVAKQTKGECGICRKRF
ncbi:MAG TPA: RING finger protein, partial [Polyangiaceae bacterium]